MIHPRPRRVPVEQRDRLIQRLSNLLRHRPEIRFALAHGSFPAGGLFRDVDRALYLEPEAIQREAFRDYELEQGIR